MKYYSKKEAAAVLGLNPKTIERYLLTGKMKGAKMGSTWRISEDDINSFYEIMKQETAEQINSQKFVDAKEDESSNA